MWTRGDLTRRMSVVDRRRGVAPKPHVDMVVGVMRRALRAYVYRVLRNDPGRCGLRARGNW